MLANQPLGKHEFLLRGRLGPPVEADRWEAVAESCILVLGYPRSGTTWLAKIFDSHPDILYRHEPDELSPARPDLPPEAQITAWIRQRGLRSAAKRPGFPKSWRPAPLDRVRTAFGTALAASGRWKTAARLTAHVGLPDFVAPDRWSRVRAAIKLVNWDGTMAATRMPRTRSILILRHPCGQIASVMAGLASGRFAEGRADLAPARALAARRGVTAAAFDALPGPGKFAWSWLAFNEPVADGLGRLPNARIILYEELCRDPGRIARDLFAFAGLDWHPQTAAFLESSTRHGRASGYYDVFRTTGIVADRWRHVMSRSDQEAVRAAVRTSPLSGWWPDLAMPRGPAAARPGL
jgi:hypothetical protein